MVTLGSIGVLNLAPLKLSGQFKIVRTVDGVYFLDDYTGRRVVLDLTKDYLSQVSNFLKVKMLMTNTDGIKYGAYQRSTIKSFHIPLYLGSKLSDNKLPDNFILQKWYKNIENSDILINVPLDDLKPIFISLMDKFDMPLYWNFQDSKIKLIGFSYDNNTISNKEISTIDLQSNQTTLNVVNNKILNYFVKEHLIFPLFVNLEFEFDFFDNLNHFQQFYGGLFYKTEVSNNTDIGLYCKEKDYVNIDNVITQITNGASYSLDNYIDIVSTTPVKEVNIQSPQFRFKIHNIMVNDTIRIIHPNGDVEFEYVVTNDDIGETLYSTSLRIAKSINNKSKMLYGTYVQPMSDGSCVFKIIINSDDEFIEDFEFELPEHFIVLDRLNFKINNPLGLTNYDVTLPGKYNLSDDINVVRINSEYIDIIGKFKFNDELILRINSMLNLTTEVDCELFINKTEKLYRFDVIPYLGIDFDFTANELFSVSNYVNNLLIKYPAMSDSIKDFYNNAGVTLHNAYWDFSDNGIDDTKVPTLTKNTEINLQEVFVMYFMFGINAYLLPCNLSIDKIFGQQNASADFQLVTDSFKYSWFLLKGEVPDYLKADDRSLRYFTDKPKIFSKIIKYGSTCETVFLGVKYILPQRYQDFKFAVYLDYETMSNKLATYEFEEYDDYLLLKVSKYLGFTDLIRGGNINNPGLIDLSFFYNIKKSYNSLSNNIADYSSLSMKLCQKPEVFYLFMNDKVTDWKKEYDGKWYICISRDSLYVDGELNDFKNLLDVKSKVLEFSSFINNSLRTIVTLENIIQIEEDYLWCEDVTVRFFPDDELEITILDDDNNFIKKTISKSSIISMVSDTTNYYGNYVQICQLYIDGELRTIRLLLPNRILSFKEYYFEANKIDNVWEVFRFPNYVDSTTDTAIILQFCDNLASDTYHVDLFDRNQVWKIISDLLSTSIKTKFTSAKKINQIIDDLSVVKLHEYCLVNQIPITFSSRESDISISHVNVDLPLIDKNVVIWKPSTTPLVTLISRIKAPYYPAFTPIGLREFQFDSSTVTTGTWREITSAISTLFVKQDSIIITKTITSAKISIIDLMKDYVKLDINQCLIDSDYNADYIKSINMNINEFIVDNYSKYLLNFYKINSIFKDNMKIQYSCNYFDIELNAPNIQQTLVFVFTRK